MRISTKGRYGLRAMLDLAVNSVDEQMSIKSIAERQQISENYLEQVFASLRKAGLVKSIKGSQGGYILAAVPSEIKVGEVLKAMEGSLDVVETSDETNEDKSEIEMVIQTHVWQKMNECISGFVDSITLQSLAEKHKELNEKKSFMYYI